LLAAFCTVLADNSLLTNSLSRSVRASAAIPYCVDTELTEEDTFLILACDGVRPFLFAALLLSPHYSFAC
jgi:hypothetical protein